MAPVFLSVQDLLPQSARLSSGESHSVDSLQLILKDSKDIIQEITPLCCEFEFYVILEESGCPIIRAITEFFLNPKFQFHCSLLPGYLIYSPVK